ncbi:unnamed protein product, partial [Ascophyllum nodosum]
DDGPTTKPAAAAPGGVVIRVLISGAHASFLHMRVFPSTTAGQVCRKIADKLRQPPSEQAEHVLIAVYPRPVNVSCGDDLGEESGVHSDDEVVGREPPADDRVMTTESFHGGGLERVEIRRRRSGSRGQTGSIRHVLHTFRPEERLGELRLGVHEVQPLPPQPTVEAAATPLARVRSSEVAAGGEGYRGDDHDNEVGVGRDKKASGDRWDRSNDETDRDFGDGGDGKGTGDDGKGSGSRSMVHGRSEIRRALMWRSRWIYRDKRALPLEADELQVEVSGSETSEDEARAGWVNLWRLGQGHYCGYLLKKSRRDLSLWRRRWCILADDRLWILRSKSDQSGIGLRRNSHSHSLSLVPCVVRAVSRSAAPSSCFELHAQSRVHLFRAENRAKQVAWVNALQRQARQAAEDSYISVAEHMMCDEEFARCRRLNDVVSSALGSRAYIAIENSSFAAPLPMTSGLFRRSSAARTALSPASSPSLGVSKNVAGTTGTGTGCGCPLGDGVEAPALFDALAVKRGLRFCMKVHRFREMSRPGSCVAIRKRWAYVADALEELCPGATDRNHWPPSTNTPANAPPPKLALAASGSGSGAASAASAAAADTTAAATATVAAAAVTAALSSEPESAERPPSLEGTASVVGRRVVAGAAADAPSDAHPAAKALSDPAASPSASAAAASAETAMPMATVHAVAVPNPRPARPNHVLPRPSLPVSTENVMAVAKELWDYVRESTPAGARARGEGVGGRYSPSLPWSAPP